MGLRILYVEDHEDTREVLGRLLRHFGFEVCCAETCQAARMLLDASTFDVLLSDIGLPDGDGCDLVAEAKRKQPLRSLALTAFTAETDRERGRTAGFDHYLTKPVNVGRLRSLLTDIAAQAA